MFTEVPPPLSDERRCLPKCPLHFQTNDDVCRNAPYPFQSTTMLAEMPPPLSNQQRCSSKCPLQPTNQPTTVFSEMTPPLPNHPRYLPIRYPRSVKNPARASRSGTGSSADFFIFSDTSHIRAWFLSLRISVVVVLPPTPFPPQPPLSFPPQCPRSPDPSSDVKPFYLHSWINTLQVVSLCLLSTFGKYGLPFLYPRSTCVSWWQDFSV